MPLRLAALLLLAGCGDALLCGDRTTEVDGSCIGDEPADDDPGDDTDEPGPAYIQDVLENLTECDEPPGDGTLNIARGCADGICARKNLEETTQAAGEVPDCTSWYGEIRCRFGLGVEVVWSDRDGDGEIGPDEESSYLQITAPYAGRTTDGLGVGVSTGCFLDRRPTPAYVEWMRGAMSWRLSKIRWESPLVEVIDVQNEEGTSERPDGNADRIRMWAIGDG